MEQKRIEYLKTHIELCREFKVDVCSLETLSECVSEIERLQKELDDERSAHAMTKQSRVHIDYMNGEWMRISPPRNEALTIKPWEAGSDWEVKIPGMENEK